MKAAWLRFLIAGIPLVWLSCAHHEAEPPADTVPFDQRLAQFSAIHNAAQPDRLRTFFAKGATVQSPVTLRPAGVESFLKALTADPYTLHFTATELLYSLPGRATTRSRVEAMSPGRFRMNDEVTVDWRMEDNYWRIARIRFPAWPAVVGTWRRSGLRNEGALELRLGPDGRYVVYVSEDYSVPAFRGSYSVEGNRLTLTDTSAEDPSQFQPGVGTYLFVRTANGAEFRRLSEDNSWRGERFDGAWVAW